MSLFIQIVIFVISLAILVKSADVFTNSAEKIGEHFGVSSFLIGVTIIAIGTSLPELMSSLIAVLKGSSEIVIGNVAGANIANLLLITGLAAVLYEKTVKLDFDFSKLDIALFLCAPVLLFASAWNGVFGFSEALLCLVIFAVYMRSIIKSQNKRNEKNGRNKPKKFNFLLLLYLVLSGTFLYLGARFTVESVINLAEILKIGKEIIAISAVSVGTTLPEMMVTVFAIKKNKPEIALGNVMGSTIFNALAVMGIPGLFGAILIPSTILKFALPVMLAATFIYALIIRNKKIYQWQGCLLLALYVLFIAKLFIRA